MGTITGKVHQNPLKTVGGVAETRLCLRTDVQTDGRTEGQTDEPKTTVPFELTSGDKKHALFRPEHNNNRPLQNVNLFLPLRIYLAN